MPIKQIPLLGPRGVHQTDDVAGDFANYPYFLNGVFEKVDASETASRNIAYVKRHGLGSSWNSVAVTNNHKIVGMIANHDRTSLFAFSNTGTANKAWVINAGSVSDLGAVAYFGNSTQAVFTRLDPALYNSYHAAVTDFAGAAVIDSLGAWTQISDADFPTPHTNFAALDGYIFMGVQTTNRIYNSDLNAPTAWTSTSFLVAGDTPGRLMWLMKVRNFLVVFKEDSVEFFENIGNPTPGSPLEPRKQLNRNIGCINRSSIQEVSDGIIFIGKARTGAPKLYKLDSNSLNIAPISDRYLEQCLPQLFTAYDQYSCDSVKSNSFIGQSQAFNVDGKEFYTINAPSPVGDQLTHVWDNDLKVWTNWASSTATSGTNDTLGFIGSQAQMVATSAGTYPVFVNNLASGASAPPKLQIMIPQLAGAATDVANSGGGNNNFIFTWTSDNYDFGSRKRKFMDSFEVHYTVNSSAGIPSNSASTTITLRYRDKDYNTTSGHYVTRTMYFDPASGTRCWCTRLGNFRRRNFNLKYVGNQLIRIWSVECQINEGEQDQEG